MTNPRADGGVPASSGWRALHDELAQAIDTTRRRIATREDQLRARRAVLNEQLTIIHSRMNAHRTPPTMASVGEAVMAARESLRHAIATHHQTAEAHTRNADVHERAAAMLDERGRSERARWHRDAAGRERAAYEANLATADEAERTGQPTGYEAHVYMGHGDDS